MTKIVRDRNRQRETETDRKPEKDRALLKSLKIILGFINLELETKRILVTQETGPDMLRNSGRKSM